MSRLIDADVFEVVCFQGKSEEFCEGEKYILEMLDAQPTAYDVNEVIRKLEKIKGHYGYYGSEECEYVPYENAIEIVRKGGVE